MIKIINKKKWNGILINKFHIIFFTYLLVKDLVYLTSLKILKGV
jgi:hypothetical protein